MNKIERIIDEKSVDVKTKINLEYIYEKNRNYFDVNTSELEIVADILSKLYAKGKATNVFLEFYKSGNHLHQVNESFQKLAEKMTDTFDDFMKILSFDVVIAAKDKKYTDERIELIRQEYVRYKLHTLFEIPATFSFIKETKDTQKMLKELFENQDIIDDDEISSCEMTELVFSLSADKAATFLKETAFLKEYGNMTYEIKKDDIREIIYIESVGGKVFTEEMDIKNFPKKFNLDICGIIPSLFTEAVIHDAEVLKSFANTRCMYRYLTDLQIENFDMLYVETKNNRCVIFVSTNIKEIEKHKDIDAER